MLFKLAFSGLLLKRLIEIPHREKYWIYHQKGIRQHPTCYCFTILKGCTESGEASLFAVGRMFSVPSEHSRDPLRGGRSWPAWVEHSAGRERDSGSHFSKWENRLLGKLNNFPKETKPMNEWESQFEKLRLLLLSPQPSQFYWEADSVYILPRDAVVDATSGGPFPHWNGSRRVVWGHTRVAQSWVSCSIPALPNPATGF